MTISISRTRWSRTDATQRFRLSDRLKVGMPTETSGVFVAGPMMQPYRLMDFRKAERALAAPIMKLMSEPPSRNCAPIAM